MNLLNLAPDVQEDILFLPLTEAGRDPIKEWQVRPIAAESDWRRQRKMWRQFKMDTGMSPIPKERKVLHDSHIRSQDRHKPVTAAAALGGRGSQTDKPERENYLEPDRQRRDATTTEGPRQATVVL
jgi:hypothetical protein